jgi:hypothetical protein
MVGVAVGALRRPASRRNNHHHMEANERRERDWSTNRIAGLKGNWTALLTFY